MRELFCVLGKYFSGCGQVDRVRKSTHRRHLPPKEEIASSTLASRTTPFLALVVAFGVVREHLQPRPPPPSVGFFFLADRAVVGWAAGPFLCQRHHTDFAEGERGLCAETLVRLKYMLETGRASARTHIHRRAAHRWASRPLSRGPEMTGPRSLRVGGGDACKNKGQAGTRLGYHLGANPESFVPFIDASVRQCRCPKTNALSITLPGHDNKTNRSRQSKVINRAGFIYNPLSLKTDLLGTSAKKSPLVGVPSPLPFPVRRRRWTSLSKFSLRPSCRRARRLPFPSFLNPCRQR